MTRAFERKTDDQRARANAARTTSPPPLIRRAWAFPRDVTSQQLTHAVEPGRTVAFCGTRTTERGGNWASNKHDGAPATRCPLCTSAVRRLARGSVGPR